MLLQYLQSLLNQVCQILVLSLRVVNLVPNVQPLILEHVENGKNLPVVWHQGLPDHLTS